MKDRDEFPMLIVGNKADLPKRQVSPSYLKTSVVDLDQELFVSNPDLARMEEQINYYCISIIVGRSFFFLFDYRLFLLIISK